MNPEQIVRDSVGADALGLSDTAFDDLIVRVLNAAEDATDDPAAQVHHALAYLYGMEARYWRRQFNAGGGPDGTFSLAEIGARMAAAQAEQAAAQAAYDRLTAPVSVTKSRGSGSVPWVMEP